MPAGPGVRVDTGLRVGDRIPPEYDNLIAKVMVYGADREMALDRLVRTLDEVQVAGVQTTLPFHRWVARDPAFRAAAELSTEWVGDRWDGAAERAAVAERAAQLAALAVLQGATAGRLGQADVPNGRAAGPRSSADTPLSGWSQAAREAAVDRWPR